eukprot:m.203727 g.203727  ORF g.203727 m.203727 type:complete len:397 (+) comp22223_c0_seq1:36-1226(+)
MWITLLRCARARAFPGATVTSLDHTVGTYAMSAALASAGQPAAQHKQYHACASLCTTRVAITPTTGSRNVGRELHSGPPHRLVPHRRHRIAYLAHTTTHITPGLHRQTGNAWHRFSLRGMTTSSDGASTNTGTGKGESSRQTEGETEDERLARLQANPFYDKYRDKLATVDLSQLDDAGGAGTKLGRPDMDPAIAALLQPESHKPASGRLAADRDSSMKPLDSIVKMDKLEEADVDTIKALWSAYHATIKGVGAVIPAEIYAKLRKRNTECPMFVVPLPRSEGIEFFFLQWRAHQAAFTSLLEWQTHGENAVPYVLLNHYTDFADSKGVVLMTADLDDNVTLMDAQFLANEIQIYYLGEDAEFDLVRKFNHDPQAFDHNEVLERLDTMVRAGASDV